MDLVNHKNNNNLTWATMNMERITLIREQLELQRSEHVRLFEEHKKQVDFFTYIIGMFKVENPNKKISDHLEGYIHQILEKHITLKMKDLVHFIEEMPIAIDTTNLYNLVYSVLRGNERFVKIGRGKWALNRS